MALGSRVDPETNVAANYLRKSRRGPSLPPIRGTGLSTRISLEKKEEIGLHQRNRHPT